MPPTFRTEEHLKGDGVYSSPSSPWNTGVGRRELVGPLKCSCSVLGVVSESYYSGATDFQLRKCHVDGRVVACRDQGRRPGYTHRTEVLPVETLLTSVDVRTSRVMSKTTFYGPTNLKSTAIELSQ